MAKEKIPIGGRMEEYMAAAASEPEPKNGIETEYAESPVKTKDLIKGKKKSSIPRGEEPPPEVSVQRWMQYAHNVMQLWVYVLRKHMPEDKVIELVNDWGALQGVYSGMLYRDIMHNLGWDKTDLFDYTRMVEKSRVFMREAGQYFMLDDDAVLFQTFMCPTHQMFEEMGGEMPKACITQCDKWFERNIDMMGMSQNWRLVRTKNKIDDEYCEWILYKK